MSNQVKLSKFSHVMNDDMTGTTFIYFASGTVQNLDEGGETEYGEHCIWLDEQDHKKLEAALRKEPYNCTVFNDKEMQRLKNIISFLNEHNVKLKKMFANTTMSDEEWTAFLEKLE